MPKEQKAEVENNARATRSQTREWLESIVIALVLAMFIRTFVVQAFKIPSGSMEPTLLVGDHLLVNKFKYGTKIPFTDIKIFPLSQPARGDVIVFRYPVDPSKDFIKRVVGIPGDRIEIKDKKLFLNDNLVNDPHAFHTEAFIRPQGTDPRDNFGPVVIPPDSYFVMGDNRDNSMDSRYWGFVKSREIRGNALILYWSWDRDRFVPRFGRIGNIIY